LVTPPARSTTKSGFKDRQCGGHPKGISSYLTISGAGINLQWKVKNGYKNAYCRLAIANGKDLIINVLGNKNEQKFYTLYPLDKTASNDGMFPCGSMGNAVETKTIRLPPGFKCSDCILQLTWKLNGREYYSCSDILLPQVWYDSRMDDYICNPKNPNSVCIRGYYPHQRNP